MKRAAIYARVSTDRQAQEGDSIPAQLSALRKYIDGREDLVLAGEYVDDGISGTREDRDELRRLVADVEAGKVDLILITKLDRLYRSIRHYLALMERLDKCGVGWLAIWEPIYDTTTPQGRLIVNQMMSIAQFEAENTGQRVRSVMAYKAAKGEVVSGSVSPGYKIENKRLVIDDKAAEDVRAVFRFFNESGNLDATLRRRGPGMPHTHRGLKMMLRNRVYIGEYHGNPAFCPALIDKDLFDMVQVQLSRNIKKDQRHTYIFSGLIRCAECGLKMSSSCNGQALRYICRGHYKAPCVCDNRRSIREDRLEGYLLDNIQGLIKGVAYEAAAAEKPARDAEKVRDGIQKKLDRLKALYLDEVISLDEYKKDRAALEADMAALDSVTVPAAPKAAAFDPVAGMDLYRGLDPEGKRFFWRQIIKSISCDSAGNISIIFL